MLITIDPSDPRAIYVQIVDEVRRAIVLGTVRHDDALPSVRQLAVELRVNPNTVLQAYRELERQGVVEMRRGQGTYVAKTSVNGAERRALAKGVAQRALIDAHRHGLDADDLIKAIRAASAHRSSEDSE
jgi:GntR family transcriptional regulator